MTTVSADKLASVGDGKCFYTYMHTRKSDGKVFYVGKGKKGRAWSRDGRSSWWRRVAESHGVIVDICARWASEDDAFNHEIFLIGVMRSLGQPLVNSTDGGEGVSGHKRTPEQIAAISERRRRWLKTEAGIAAARRSSEFNKLLMQDEEIKSAAVAGMVAWTKDPANRSAVLERMRVAREVAKSPDIETRRVASMRRTEMETGAISARAKAQMNDPAFFAKLNAARDAYFSVDENREVVGNRMRAYYAMPESKERLVAAIKARESDPARRAEKSRARGGAPFTHMETMIVYQTQGEASRATGLSQSAISNVLHGKKNSVRGQHFVYNHSINKEVI